MEEGGNLALGEGGPTSRERAKMCDELGRGRPGPRKGPQYATSLLFFSMTLILPPS